MNWLQTAQDYISPCKVKTQQPHIKMIESAVTLDDNNGFRWPDTDTVGPDQPVDTRLHPARVQIFVFIVAGY